MFIYHFNRLIRNRILWAFFAILIAFAFVAVDSCFKNPQTSETAGTLNGEKISLSQFEQTVQAIRGFGHARDNETSATIIDQRAWEQIAARQIAEKNGMASNKEEVRAMLREIPNFQGANGFDINRYRAILSEQGLTPSLYEDLVAHQLAIMKDAALVESASWISPMELEDELASMTDRFTVRVATVSNRFAQADMHLTDTDLHKYYDENKASFALPDRIAVRYIAIPVSNFLASAHVPEDDLQEYYDSHTETFSRTTTNNTTEVIPYAEVRGKILAELQMDEARYCASTTVTFNIYGKLAKVGSSNALDIVAAQNKLTIKTSPLFGADDTLYWADNSKEFAAAAFDLDPDRNDSRYGIVKGDHFVYVIEPFKRSPAHTPTYQEVLADLRPRAIDKARSEAFQKYTKDLHKDLTVLIKEGKSFMDAAKAKALNVSTSITYTVSDIQNEKFDHSFSIAYGAMTLKKKELSEAIPASAVQSLFVYIQDRQPGDALAAEMMRSQVCSSISRRRNRDFFKEWLAWNLKQQEFVPAHPLTQDEAETGIDKTDDDVKDAEAPKNAADEK